jgi:hypothetical protein
LTTDHARPDQTCWFCSFFGDAYGPPSFSIFCVPNPLAQWRNVGIIGAGPSGWCYGYMSCRGYLVEVYDKRRSGGLMLFRYSRIPHSQGALDLGVRALERKGGVLFHTTPKFAAAGRSMTRKGTSFP